MASRKAGEDLGRALQEKAVLAVRELDDNAHALALGGEGDHLDDLGSLADRLVMRPSLLLSKGHESGLGLGTDETALGAVLVGTLEGSRVDDDRVVEELLECGRDVRVDVAGVGGKVETTLTSGSFEALGLLALRFESRELLGVAIVVGVGASRVLLETLNELEVDADRASDDGHLVRGEGTGLVRADLGREGRVSNWPK